VPFTRCQVLARLFCPLGFELPNSSNVVCAMVSSMTAAPTSSSGSAASGAATRVLSSSGLATVRLPSNQVASVHAAGSRGSRFQSQYGIAKLVSPVTCWTILSIESR
jgi:hypothetical protein